ncbi:winged helix-turn-helix transcriptional regulator [Silvibacterium acidisoli]|uniref:winged helix-turn-helix transcriptional regulator n=1 Tax=Acidobacteriaceae bacterium ZG23-2 TaxID=2883246 RepID=UPI00406C28F0
MENHWKMWNAECAALEPEREILALEITTQMADKWLLWTLSVLAEEGSPLRFSRIMERVEGVSQKSLTKTLRQLERDGLVTREMFPEVPPRVEYTITELGLGMLEHVRPLWLWTVQNLENFERARRKYDERRG